MNKIRSVYYTNYMSPIGKIIVATYCNKIMGLWFEGQKYFPKETSEWIENNDIEILISAKNWLDRYFYGKKPNIFELPILVNENYFRRIVFDILCDIPYGETRTYKQIAEITAKILNKTNMSAQAVGSAISHNPISIIIPCHRVVATNGSLTGYAGGIDKKKWLLDHEQAIGVV